MYAAWAMVVAIADRARVTATGGSRESHSRGKEMSLTRMNTPSDRQLDKYSSQKEDTADE